MISVIIATKNGSQFIPQAIQSVLNQRFAFESDTKDQLEIIVINDGSTDQTAQVVQKLIEKDNRIKLISLSQNVGPGSARNMGIKSARGDYIAFIDDDDRWISLDKLVSQKDFLNANPEYVLVGAATIDEVNEHGHRIRVYKNPETDTSIRQRMLKRNCFVSSSVMFKKSAYEKTGGFKQMYLAEDYDLWLRMGMIGKFANLHEIEIEYTIRKGNASTSRQLEMYKNIVTLVKEYRTNYPGFLIAICMAYGRVLIAHIKNLF